MSTNEEYLDSLLKTMEESTPNQGDAINLESEEEWKASLDELLDSTDNEETLDVISDMSMDEMSDVISDMPMDEMSDVISDMPMNEVSEEPMESLDDILSAINGSSDSDSDTEASNATVSIDDFFAGNEMSEAEESLSSEDDMLALLQSINDGGETVNEEEAAMDEEDALLDLFAAEQQELYGEPETEREVTEETQEQTDENIEETKKEKKKKKKFSFPWKKKKEKSVDSQEEQDEAMVIDIFENQPESSESEDGPIDIFNDGVEEGVDEQSQQENTEEGSNAIAEEKPKKAGFFSNMMEFLLQEEEEEEEPDKKKKKKKKGKEQEAQEGQEAGAEGQEENQEEDNKGKKGKKDKKKKKKRGKKGKGEAEGEEENQQDKAEGEGDEEEEKGKKKKKKREKKEKPEKVKEKTPAVLKKKARMALVAFCATLIGAIVALSYFLPDYADKKNARAAFYVGDYEKAYVLLYNKNLNDSDKLILNRVELVLSMERIFANYESAKSAGENAKSLDILLNGVARYGEITKAYGAEEELAAIYQQILNILEQDFAITEEEAKEINLYDSVKYSQKIYTVTEGANYDTPSEEEVIEEPQVPQDILPEEEAIIQMNAGNEGA